MILEENMAHGFSFNHFSRFLDLHRNDDDVSLKSLKERLNETLNTRNLENIEISMISHIVLQGLCKEQLYQCLEINLHPSVSQRMKGVLRK